VGEGGRGEDGLLACPCDTPVGDAPRPVELSRGDPVGSLVDSPMGNSLESCQSPKPMTSVDPAHTSRYLEVTAHTYRWPFVSGPGETSIEREHQHDSRSGHGRPQGMVYRDS